MGAITYTWKADGSTVGTGATYTLTQAEVGKTITVEASYTDGQGTAMKRSASVSHRGLVSNVNDAPTGSRHHRQHDARRRTITLTAANTLADEDGLGAITYTWKADGSTVGTGSDLHAHAGRGG